MPADLESRPDTVLFDVDGTLMDSNYQHVAAWVRAFNAVGHPVPAATLHRAIGMGGDKLVTEVAGEDVEAEHGDALREGWVEAFDDLIDDVRPVPGAADLLRACAQAGLTVVLASSGKAAHLERFRALLDADDVIAGQTTSDDVDASKPDGDLFEAAMAKVGGSVGVVVGDSPWDASAASAAGVACVLVRSGGFCDPVLHEANPGGALYDDTADLLAQLTGSPLLAGHQRV